MAERGTFKKLVERGGWCCRFGLLAIEDLKAAKTADGRLMPSFFVRRFGFAPESGGEILAKWREDYYRCEKHPQCLLVKAGIRREDLPTLSDSRRDFLALKGQHYNCYKAAQPPIRTGEPIKGTIISQSQVDWLWVVIGMERVDPSVCLGDQVWLDNVMYGTVIDIDGPNLTLLLPGPWHKQRNRKMHTSAK